jgi:hypothetical protein
MIVQKQMAMLKRDCLPENKTQKITTFPKKNSLLLFSNTKGSIFCLSTFFQAKINSLFFQANRLSFFKFSSVLNDI